MYTGLRRRHRLLEDDRDFFRADLLHLLLAERHQVAALPQHLAGDDFPRRHVDQLQHRLRGDALAAPRLADDAHRLAAVDGKVHAIDRVQPSVVGLEVGLQALNLQESHHRTRLGSSASRSPSPMKLIVNTVRKIARPGNSAQCTAKSM